ncbi:MAG: hypothetical protein ACREJ2_09865 [Planctomycetota bacterium]
MLRALIATSPATASYKASAETAAVTRSANAQRVAQAVRFRLTASPAGYRFSHVRILPDAGLPERRATFLVDLLEGRLLQEVLFLLTPEADAPDPSCDCTAASETAAALRAMFVDLTRLLDLPAQSARVEALATLPAAVPATANPTFAVGRRKRGFWGYFFL